MKKVASLNNDKKTRFAFIDFFNIRTEEDFLEKYSAEIIRCGISKKEELLQAGKEFFQKLSPSFSFGADPVNDFSLTFSWRDSNKSKDEIINSPNGLQRKKGLRSLFVLMNFKESPNLGIIYHLNRNFAHIGSTMRTHATVCMEAENT